MDETALRLRLFLPIRKSFLLPLGKANLAAATKSADRRGGRSSTPTLPTPVHRQTDRLWHRPAPALSAALETFGEMWGQGLGRSRRPARIRRPRRQLIRATTVTSTIEWPREATVRRIAFVDDPTTDATPPAADPPRPSGDHCRERRGERTATD
jgi:hypothetical protein